MEDDTDVHVRWNSHQNTLLSVFSSLLDNGNLVDCTIGAEGQYFKAHRVILSACSPYFESLFNEHYEKHPIIIVPDVKFPILKALMEFMYYGEVSVPQKKLNTVLKLAETLQIKGLSFSGDSDLKNELRLKRRNESAILPEQHGFTDNQHGTQVGQMEDGAIPPTLGKESTTGINSLPPASQECDKDISKSVPNGETVEEPGMSQDGIDTKDFSVFQSSSLTQTLTKSSTHVTETVLSPVSNSVGTTQVQRSSEENVSEQSVSNENVISKCSPGSVPRTLQPQTTHGERPVLDMQPEIKEENLDEHTVEEIILDDEDSDDSDHGRDDDYTATARGLVKVVPEKSFRGQDFCSMRKQHRDAYFVQPVSILPSRFKCKACGRSYRYHGGLLRHLKYECGKEPQFKCPHCPVRYTHKHNLKAHMIRFHRFHLPY